MGAVRKKDVHTRAPVDSGVCSAGLAHTQSNCVPAHIKLRIRAYARTQKLAFVACFTPNPMPAEMVRLQKTRQCLLAGSQRATLMDTWPCRFFALSSCNGLPRRVISVSCIWRSHCDPSSPWEKMICQFLVWGKTDMSVSWSWKN